jgi:hypothetical protein
MRDYIKQRLAAAGLRVKPLQWQETYIPFADTVYRAEEYTIKRNADFCKISIGPYVYSTFTRATIEEAKSLCQADYERGILSVLEVTP